MDWHALLLLSAPGSTQALRTDEELDELPPAASGLRLDRRTLLAGNLLSASRIVQARPQLLWRQACGGNALGKSTQGLRTNGKIDKPPPAASILRLKRRNRPGIVVVAAFVIHQISCADEIFCAACSLGKPRLKAPVWHCQVHTGGVVLLAGTTKLQEMLLDDLAPPPSRSECKGGAAGITGPGLHEVAAASIADPYLLIYLTNGGAALLRADADKGARPACLKQTLHTLHTISLLDSGQCCTDSHASWVLSAASQAPSGEVPCQGCWSGHRSRQRCSPQRAGRPSPPAASTWTPAAGCRPGWSPRTWGSWTTRRHPQAHLACSAWWRAPAGCSRCMRCRACSCSPSFTTCPTGRRYCSSVSQRAPHMVPCSRASLTTAPLAVQPRSRQALSTRPRRCAGTAVRSRGVGSSGP